MYPELSEYIQNIVFELDAVPSTSYRYERLIEIVDFIKFNQAEGKPIKLTFICTHNSRRSHLCQIWAATAAEYYGVSDILTYSGGTEATNFNPRAVSAIERAGFKVQNPGGDNPHYNVSMDVDIPVMECFSKVYDDPYNPQHDFAAIMTCSDADENCPVVFGASKRVSLTYIDPKESDGTPQESEVYDERCRQIAGEMFWMMRKTVDC